MSFPLQIQQEAIEMSEFEQKMLPALMDMAEDKVPNVRLVVGKCLYKCAQSGELGIERIWFIGPMTNDVLLFSSILYGEIGATVEIGGVPATTGE